VRFLFYHLMWSLGNYVVRNPQARKAAGQGCLALILLWVGVTLLSAIAGAVGATVAAIDAWVTTTTDSVIVLMGVGLALMVGAITYALAARPVRRKRLSRPWRTLKSRLGRADAGALEGIEAGRTPALPAADGLDKIRFPAKTENPGMALPYFDGTVGGDDELLDQIVIHGGE